MLLLSLFEYKTAQEHNVLQSQTAGNVKRMCFHLWADERQIILFIHCLFIGLGSEFVCSLQVGQIV